MTKPRTAQKILRICLLTSHRYGELLGGVERFIESFSKWLYKNGIVVVTVARKLSFLKPVSVTCSNISSGPFPVKHTKIAQKIPSMLYVIYMLIYTVIAALYVMKLNKKHRFLIIHAQDLNFAGLSAIIAKKLCNIPVILHSHGPYIYLLRFAKKGQILFETYMNKVVAQVADRIIVTDAVTKSYLLSLGIPARKVKVIPTAIEMELFEGEGKGKVNTILKEIGVSHHDFLLGYVGRLSKEKNIDALIKAFSQICKKEEGNPQFKLLIVGDGPEKIRLVELAKKYNVGNSVIFTGWRTDIPGLLAAIDVFLLPSYVEGVPLSLLEAMAAGKAIIASDIPTLRAIVRHGEEAILVKPFDTEGLKRAILTLYSNSDLRRKLGCKARQRAKFYDVGVVYNRILDVYADLLKEKAKP
jgi:glycosyltransferase involved in cell wall biosynthesis